MKHKGRGPAANVDFGRLRRRLPAILLAVVVCLYIGWLVVRTAAVTTLSRARPHAAAVLAPKDPQVIAGFVAMEMRNRLGMTGPAAKAAAREALLRAPLMEEPFLIGGIERVLKRDNRAATIFIGHALARNPRSRLARLFMLELELRARDVGSAAANMTILSRLMPEAQKVFIPELARLAQDPDTSDALRETIRTDPKIHAGVLNYLVSRKARPEVVLELAGPKPPVDDVDWRQALLGQMVERGDVGRARLLWARFSGLKPGEAPLVYDGDFRGLPGLPPFNWTPPSSSEHGAAERDRNGGLVVEYYGRSSVDLTSQMLVLAPGSYRLLFRAEGDLRSGQPRLFWRVRCVQGNRTLLELPVSNVTFAGRTIAGAFTVPQGCPAQWLRLSGEPTEFPKIENVLLRDLQIRKAATS